MKVELGTLKDKSDDLIAFLEPRVGTKPTLSGSALEMEDEALRKGVKPRHIKTYLKRFLYTSDLRKNYRILVQGGELTIQELELGEKEKEEREKLKEKMEEAEKKEKEEREEEPEKTEAAPPEPEKKEDEPKAEKNPKGQTKKKETANS